MDEATTRVTVVAGIMLFTIMAYSGNCQQCWTSTSCDGRVATEASSKRNCCLNTVEGMSFGDSRRCEMCGELRFNFKSDEYEIPEAGDQNPIIVLEHSALSQPVEITVTLLTMEEAQTDPYDPSAFFEGIAFEGTNATKNDFNSTSHTILLSIGTNETELQNYIEVVDDVINEPTQYLALVASVSGLGIEKTICFAHGRTGSCQGRTGLTVLKIIDNDAIMIGFDSMTDVSEASPIFPIIIRTNTTSELLHTLRVAYVDGVGNATLNEYETGIDAVFEGTQTYDFIEGERDKIISSTIKNDFIVESTEVFRLNITFIDENSTATCQMNDTQQYRCNTDIFILDDDSPFQIGFETEQYNVSEAEGMVKVCVAFIVPGESDINGVGDTEVDVYIFSTTSLKSPAATSNTTSNSQMPGLDFEWQSEKSNLLQLNNTQRRVCIDLPVYDDTAVEQSECATLSVIIDYATNTSVVHPVTNIRIDDNDKAVVGFENTFYRVREDNGYIVICAAIIQPVISIDPIQFPFEVEFAVNSATAMASVDFIVMTDRLKFEVGQTQSCANVSIVKDDDIEPVESFTAHLLRVSDLHTRITLDPDTAQVEILDQDVDIGWEETSYTITDSLSGVDVCGVVYSTISRRNVTVHVESELERPGIDYEAVDRDLGPFSAPGQSLCFNISVANACYFSLIMSSEDSDVHISVPVTTVIVGTDRERCAPITVGYEKPVYTTTDAAGEFELCAVITNPATGAPRPFTLLASTTLPLNYVAISNKHIQFDTGHSRQCYGVVLIPHDECELESNASFMTHLDMVSGAGNITVDPQSVRVIIKDSLETKCVPISVGFTHVEYTATEGDGEVSVCAVITNPKAGAPRPFNLSYAIGNGSADAPDDYSAVGSGVLVFSVGDRSVCCKITINDDNVCEDDPNENIIIHLEVSGNTPKVTVESATARVIIDDANEPDCKTDVKYEQVDYTTTESMGNVTLCVVVVEPPNREHKPNGTLLPFNLSISVVDGTTEAGADYSVDNEVLYFNIGDTQQCHTINIIADEQCEFEDCASEFFNSQLQTSTSQVNLVSPIARVVIDDLMEVNCSDVFQKMGCTPDEISLATPGSDQTDSSVYIYSFIPAAVILTVLVVILILIIATYRWRNRKQNVVLREDTVTELPDDTYRYLPEHSDLIHKIEQEVPQHKKFSKDQIHLSSVVGQGESGLVYKATLETVEGRELVAVKTVKALFATPDVNKLIKEIDTMLSFDHPNVMSLIGVSLDRESPLLIMPFMSKGSVLEYVKHHKEELLLTSEAETAQITSATKKMLGMCYQIAKGMQYLVEQKFVHRDLAARNCMISMSGVIKVSDFGLTEDMYATNYYKRESANTSEEKVPIRWMAPESIRNDIYTQKTDVWAFGVTCWEMFTCGLVPYHGIPAMSVLNVLTSGERLNKPNNVACSDGIYSIMYDCWKEDPLQRPTFSYLVQHIGDMLEREAGYMCLSPEGSLLMDSGKRIVEKREMEEWKEEKQDRGITELNKNEHRKHHCETVM